MSVKPIPDGYDTITPYLIVRDCVKALEFYKKAFGAKEIMWMPAPGNKIGHAEIQIGNSKIMMADEFPEMGFKGPESYGGSGVLIHLYVEDVDAQFKKAIEAGGKEERPVADQFYGDRQGSLIDPFGHHWSLSTHIEDISIEELEERSKKFIENN